VRTLTCGSLLFVPCCSVLQLHGGSAQGFADRPSWDTYGWAAFQVPNAPAGSPRTKARLEVRGLGMEA
jgi:hypothetical protein